jgi:hypothetical protein
VAASTAPSSTARSISRRVVRHESGGLGPVGGTGGGCVGLQHVRRTCVERWAA